MADLKKLIVAYETWAASRELPPETPVIRVDKIAAKVAAFYEKIRGIVDWSEEHLLRKIAIARILRRRLFLRENGESLASVFLRDLVRGGYFRNGKIPEAKSVSVEAVLKKYIFLMQGLRSFSLREEHILTDWLLSIAGCEVEALLDPPLREEALLDYMTEQTKTRLMIKKSLPDQERENLIFIAVRQALFKLDEPIITYQLIKKYIPNWNDLRVEEDRETLQKFSRELGRWYDNLHMAFSHSLLKKFYWAAEMADAPYLILGDVLTDLAQSGELKPELFLDSHWLESQAFVKYKKRLAKQKSKATRAAIYSTLSIFVSKVLIAFVLEVPIDKFTHQFSYSTLIFNITIPPILMLGIVLWGIKPPKKSNTGKITEAVKKIVNGDLPPYEIRMPGDRPLMIRAFVIFFYIIGTAITFGVMIYILTRLGFSPFSQAVFIFFISLIAFAGLKIRERSKELIIEEPPSGFTQDIIAFFTLPIVELGRWSSRQLLRIRVVAILLDVLIELPLQFFIEFIEQWRAFLKEKKQEIR